MARRFISPDTPIGAVRRYFGLNQQELAWFLDVGKAIIGHIEAGRRDLSLALRQRLLPLSRHVPPTLPPLDEELLPAATPAPEAAPLAARRAECLAKAAQLRLLLLPLAARAWHASRWQQALPAVLAELPAPTTLEDEHALVDLRYWLQRKAQHFRPSHAARYHLLRLQAEALEAEAVALAALLPAGAE